MVIDEAVAYQLLAACFLIFQALFFFGLGSTGFKLEFFLDSA
jgi:hypothetical protein